MDALVSRPQVYWRVRGGGPRTLVLVNGYSASAIAWPQEWIRSLAEDLRVITLDNRGSGWSRLAETPFTIVEMAADVLDVLDDAEIASAVVMGISMGGMIAQQVALAAPERVEALALVATRPPVPRFTQPAASSVLALTRPVLPGESFRTYMRRLWSAAAAPGFAERHPEVIEELIEQTIERPTPRGLLLQQLRAMSGWGHAERLTALRMPTTIVHGEQDRFAPIANAESLHELIPGANLLRLDGIGHLVPYEAPEILREQLLGLVAESAPRDADG
jgi:pimeloyl-ACP methyl ester carboxylesterase